MAVAPASVGLIGEGQHMRRQEVCTGAMTCICNIDTLLVLRLMLAMTGLQESKMV